ncbi:hypothetical protein ACQY1G_02885 [Agrobacterium vitis]
MKAVDQQFHAQIEPLFMNWGLSRHPNKRSYFGKEDFGYRYDFADVRDLSDVKLASFAIHHPYGSLWIRGYRLGRFNENIEELPILFDNIKGIFILTRDWSIWRPWNIKFELGFNIKQEDIPRKAEALIDDVCKNIDKLHRYLYG